MDLHLTGKRAIVTGASRGIGLAVARQLAREGPDVVLVGRDAGALERAAGLISAPGRRAVPIAADTTDDTSVRSMVAGAVAELGGVDILVNAAAKPAGSTRPPISPI